MTAADPHTDWPKELTEKVEASMAEHTAEIDARPVEGDIALVTRRSGKQYVGIYTLAPGIDYFWKSAVPGKVRNQLRDPDVSFEVFGHVTPSGETE